MDKILQKGVIDKIILLNQEDKLSLEELSARCDIFIHIHDRKTLIFNYLSKNISTEVWNIGRNEAMQMGAELVRTTIHRNSIEKAKNVSRHLNLIDKGNLTGCFYQFIRPYRGNRYTGYYTIRKIMNGNDFFSVSMPLKRLSSWNSMREKLKINQQYLANYAKHELLTTRQKDVFRFTVKELSREEIANHLKISTHTVDVYRKQIRAKTGWRQLIEWQKIAIDLFGRNSPLSSR